MSRHFPQIEEIEEWTNKYTGLTLKPSDGAEGERQANFSQNKDGIARRNAFFNPTPKKITRQEGEEEAEAAGAPDGAPAVEGAGRFAGGAPAPPWW